MNKKSVIIFLSVLLVGLTVLFAAYYFLNDNSSELTSRDQEESTTVLETESETEEEEEGDSEVENTEEQDRVDEPEQASNLIDVEFTYEGEQFRTMIPKGYSFEVDGFFLVYENESGDQANIFLGNKESFTYGDEGDLYPGQPELNVLTVNSMASQCSGGYDEFTFQELTGGKGETILRHEQEIECGFTGPDGPFTYHTIGYSKFVGSDPEFLVNAFTAETSFDEDALLIFVENLTVK